MQHTVGTPCWADLMTPDPKKARGFYRELLGWDYEIQPEEYGGYAMASVGGQNTAGIGAIPPGSEMPTSWTVYLAVDDIDRVVDRWKEADGQVITEPFEVPAQGRMAVVSDPTGAVVGLWQPLAHHGFDLIGPPGAACWFEVNTHDSEKARDFFTERFGLTAQRMEGMHYYTIHDAGRPRFGVLQMTEDWGELPPHWMVYFAVADVDRAVEAVRANGGQVTHGPFDSPQGPLAVCVDPLGAPFTVIRPTGS